MTTPGLVAVAGRFRVLATSAGFEPGFRHGGPVRSVAGILDTVSDEVDAVLITHDRDAGARDPYPGLSGRWVGRGRAQVHYLNTRSLIQWLRLCRRLSGVPFDLLYVNSLWQPRFTILPIVAAKLHLLSVRMVLIAPRGELSPGALSLKSGKKRVFLLLWGPLLNSMNVRWHASSEREAAEIRSACPRARVEVNQNPVTLPLEPMAASQTSHRTRVVYVGRITPKKNLDLTLQALQQVSRPIQFDIYGPVADARYWAHCRALISEMPSHVRVDYYGELQPARVRLVFAEHDAFIFPTRGENFGHVIAESLSASCPVVCSSATPWGKVFARGGGVVLADLSPVTITAELERLAGLSPRDRLAAKRAAGSAYREWRATVRAPNVLDQVRTSTS